MEVISLVIFGGIIFLIWYFCGGSSSTNNQSSGSTRNQSGSKYEKMYPDLSSEQMQHNSVWNLFGKGTSYDSILDRFTSLDDVTSAIKQAGLESCNLIFGKTKIND